jgi:hypothetical protein
MPVFPSRREKRNLSRVALGAALLAVLVVIAAPLKAAEAEEDDAFDTRIFRGILKGIGLRNDAPGIEYRERSPLVIPQGRNLPAPEATGAKDPNWPVEPEVKRARQAKAAERPIGGRFTGDPFLDDGKALTQTEMTPGAASNPAAVKRGANDAAPIKDWNGRPIPPDALGSKFVFGKLFKGNKDEEVAPFTGEPARATLVEPPTGYRTPSPDQPYGFAKDRSLPKPKDYLESKGSIQ